MTLFEGKDIKPDYVTKKQLKGELIELKKALNNYVKLKRIYPNDYGIRRCIDALRDSIQKKEIAISKYNVIFAIADQIEEKINKQRRYI